jgi:di/tricarboxylate transporter
VTPQIIAVLAIMLASVALFITEKIRVDIVALMVLVALAVSGLVTPAEALSGFSSPAVVTVWAVLILSGGLSRTGVASELGNRLLSLARDNQARLLLIIMLTVGVLSGFMNNIGVASLMLPVVVDAARRIGIPPSKLLLPLAFSAHLGGMATLIGTPPNILVSEALRASNLTPFGMFDYAPTGLAILAVGVVYLALVGRRLLPSRDIGRDPVRAEGNGLDELFALRERLFTLKLPKGSALEGKTLGQSRLGALVGLNVLAVMREERTLLAPEVDFRFQPGDCLLVGGRADRLAAFGKNRQLVVKDEQLPIEALTSAEVQLAEVRPSPNSTLLGGTIERLGLRREYGLNILAIWRSDTPLRTHLQSKLLEAGDVLLVQGSKTSLEKLALNENFDLSSVDQTQTYRLEERLLAVELPAESELVGATLADSHLGDAYGLQVLGIQRQGQTHLMPPPGERLEAGDTLLVEGQPDDLDVLRALQTLELNQCETIGLERLESEGIGMAEVVLSPRSRQSGKTLRELDFREKYGLSVLAIWRQGRPYRSNLRDMALNFGDALLVFGRRERLKILGRDPEFLVLTQEAAEAPRQNKALLSIIIMAAVLLPVVLGWLPIAISAVMGATLMVVTGCLQADEAYHAIEWRAIFLIAGMLPLGIALETTGAASLIAERMVDVIGAWGPLAVMAGLFLLAAIASQVMPNPAVAVLLAPIALNTARDLGISPYPLMMTVAIAASSAFLSPVGHPANVLVMGPGGYRFSDYTKVGVPLTLVVLIVSLIVVPLVWPF